MATTEKEETKMESEYRPRSRYLDSSHTRLYELESERYEVIRKCAKELQKIHGDLDDLWEAAIPAAIYDTLASYSVPTVRAAVVAWLEDNPE